VRTLFVTMAVVAAMLALTACGPKPCKDLATKACETAAGSTACEAAGRMTNSDECAGYLKDVGRFVELKNLKITEPGVNPPAPPAPPPADGAPGAVPGAAPTAAPAPAPAAP